MVGGLGPSRSDASELHRNASFFMWLAIWGRCWTTDHPARHGLLRLFVYPFCDQPDESASWLSVYSLGVDGLLSQMALRGPVTVQDQYLVECIAYRKAPSRDERDLWTLVALLVEPSE